MLDPRLNKPGIQIATPFGLAMTARLLWLWLLPKKTREGRLTCPLQYRGDQEGLNGSKVLQPFLLFFSSQLLKRNLMTKESTF